MQQLGLNWFEGGRRIRDIILWIVGLITAAVMLFGGPSNMHFEKSFPDDLWKVAKKDCGWQDKSEYIGNMEVGGLSSRSVSLCFRTHDGKFAFKGLGPNEMPPPLVTTLTAATDGAKLPEPPPQKWYYYGEEYSPEVEKYFKNSASNFDLDEAKAAIDATGIWTVRFLDFKTRINDSGLPGFAIFIGIWIITAVFGWVVRGFAGIPMGKDFRIHSLD